MAGKYYGVKRSDAFLAHYGILGMKWGVIRSPEQLGHMKIPRNASHRNLEKFGKTPDTNVCYIMGTSGSGKSTIAKNNSSKANVIHLDSYFDNPNGPKSKEFNKYLRSVGFDPNSLYKKPADRNDKQAWGKWWGNVDRLEQEIDNFGKQQFKKKKRVICEGVQLMDETMHPNKGYFKSKPHVVLNTGSITSYLRGHKLDGAKIKLSDINNIRNNRKILKKLKTDIGY